MISSLGLLTDPLRLQRKAEGCGS